MIGSLNIDCSGNGSGFRPPSLGCHASVHSDFSCRAGFPVRPAERTVSRDVAAKNFCTVCGAVSASSVVSHTEPVHAPSAPIATAAAICLPVTIPPAASTGTAPSIASMTSGMSTSVVTSPQWPPASVPCATIRSTPACTCLTRVLLGADERRDGHAALSSRFDHVVRRHAQRVGDQLDRMAERHLEQVLAGVTGKERRTGPRRLLGLDVMCGQQVGDETAVVLRDPAGELTPRQVLAFALELRRHDEVDAVGLRADVVVDPRQLLVQLLRRECRRTKHAEPAGVGDGGHHVPAVTEGEEREIDTELLTDGWLHSTSITK